MEEGALGPPLFVLYHPTDVGGLKGHETRVIFDHPRVLALPVPLV
jgi:hypothetical protein